MNNTQQAGENLTIDDYIEVLEDHKRLVKELDVLLNGEQNAAKQASLCDIVAQVRKEGIKPPDAVEAKSAGVWQLCPKCNGQGAVSRPPWIAEGVRTFVSSETGFECNLCLGKMIIPRDAGTFETATSHAEAVTATERALAYAKGKHGDHDAWQVDRAASATDYLAGHAEGEKGAVGFAEWIAQNDWSFSPVSQMWHNSGSAKLTSELYKTYLKEQ